MPSNPAVPVDRPKASKELLIVQLAAGYLTYAEGYYRKDGRPTRSMERVRTALKVLRLLYANLPVAEFGPLKLQAIQRHLVEEGKGRRYVNHLTQAIRRVSKWGVSQELVSESVYRALGTVPGLKKGRTAAKEPERIKPVVDDYAMRVTLLPVRTRCLCCGGTAGSRNVITPVSLGTSAAVKVVGVWGVNGSSPASNQGP